jgi:RsiW-degrading membrane proteinase PrsW (M82 family)
MKLRLTVENGTLAGRNYDLTEGFLTVGRGENCAVRLDPLTERAALKQHAYIETKPDGFYLIDNQSTNETFLNSRRIQIAKLNSGDSIQFGTNGVKAKVNLEADERRSEPPNFKAVFQPPESQSPRAGKPPTGQIGWRNSAAGVGVSGIQKPVEKSQTGKYIGAGIAVFSAVFLSLIVILLMFASVGIASAIGASIIAFVPAMFYLLPLVWLDRYDPEPFWLLAATFAWGALVAVVVSFIINTLFGAFFGEAFSAIVSAPVFEEGTKGLGLVLLLVFFRRYFDDILDGIIFAGVIALGFSTDENVLYYGRTIHEGKESLAAVLILRGVMSPFAHVTFTAMTGIGCGIARESHNNLIRILLPITGYGGAVLLHAI